jgi:hypothetical protein
MFDCEQYVALPSTAVVFYAEKYLSHSSNLSFFHPPARSERIEIQMKKTHACENITARSSPPAVRRRIENVVRALARNLIEEVAGGLCQYAGGAEFGWAEDPGAWRWCAES